MKETKHHASAAGVLQVPFDKPMLPAGNVEVWLAEVERRMKASVRTQVGCGGQLAVYLPSQTGSTPSAAQLNEHVSVSDTEPSTNLLFLPLLLQIIAAMHAYPSRPRTSWVREWPAMVVLAVNQIFWARGVEEALTQGTVQVGWSTKPGFGSFFFSPALCTVYIPLLVWMTLRVPACLHRLARPQPVYVHAQEFLDRCNNDLMGLTDLVQGELTEAERLTLGALITVDVHACDVVRELLEAGIKQTSDFEWVSRLRYYWRDDVFVDMAQASRDVCRPRSLLQL